MNIMNIVLHRTLAVALCAYAIINLSACGTNTVKPHTKPPAVQDFSDYYRQGIKAYEDWNESENIEHLKQSRKYLAIAYKLNPYDLATQVEYYRSQYILTALSNNLQNIKELEQFYTSMNPIAQNSMAPPAVLEYHLRKSAHATPESLIQDLHRALEQSPYNSQTWTNIADHYFDYQHYTLATAAAKIAYDFSPDNAYFAHEVGRTLSAQAEDSACVYEEADLLKRSVHYINQAGIIEKDNWQYLSNASLQYLNLGLVPLAWSQAQKAVELSQNMLTVVRYLEIAIILGKYEEAYTLLNSFLDNKQNDLSDFKYERVFTLLAILSYKEGDQDLAHRFVFQANNFANDHFYQLHSRWLYKSNEETFQSSLAKAEHLSPSGKLQVDFLKQGSTLNSDDLLGHANNRCDASDFYFSAADRAYIQGDLEQAKAYLEKVIEQKALRNLSYLWASVILARGL